MSFSWAFLSSIIQIVVNDLVLSGDNAVVIAMAAHRLPRPQRRMAILCGMVGAIALRVFFTFVLAQLLNKPYLRLLGGMILVWISLKLLVQEETSGPEVRAAGGQLKAIWTIIQADIVMSLDNMLAVGGASEGNVWLILFGLVLSIAVIMTSSAWIADRMDRYPILVAVGAAVLAWTAAEMMLEDVRVAEFLLTHTGVCITGDWHEYLKQPENVHRWFGENSPAIEHRHWIGWLFSGFIIVAVTSPYWWRVLTGRHRIGPSSAPPARTTGPADAPAPQDGPRLG